MIPEIGVLIGTYILTRMIELVTRPSERRASTLAIVFAGITAIMATVIMFDLVMSGGNVARQLQGLGK